MIFSLLKSNRLYNMLKLNAKSTFAITVPAKESFCHLIPLNTDIDGSCSSLQSVRDNPWIKEKFKKHWFIEQKINTSVSKFIFLTLQQNHFIYQKEKRCF